MSEAISKFRRWYSIDTRKFYKGPLRFIFSLFIHIKLIGVSDLTLRWTCLNFKNKEFSSFFHSSTFEKWWTSDSSLSKKKILSMLHIFFCDLFLNSDERVVKKKNKKTIYLIWFTFSFSVPINSMNVSSHFAIY